MIGNSEYCLELNNVYHSGQVDPPSWFPRLTSPPPTVLLKDVSLRVACGEVLAVLGSAGSGKRALLDVVARRGAPGHSTRGQLLLQGQPLTLSGFRQRGAYVTRGHQLLDSLTVYQTLATTPTQVSLTLHPSLVSLRVACGEVLAVLGSAGSGKRALLDVVARRGAPGHSTRGQLLLQGQPLTLSGFRQRAAYVTRGHQLLDSLTVYQTLATTPTQVSGYAKQLLIKHILSDLALTQISSRATSALSPCERRRVGLGVALMRRPALLLLDEPTRGLDPLSTYLVVSVLHHAARKYRAAVVLTLETPRSDVFPFLDHVALLCLGDVVYAGGTRQMLQYFSAIGFPCPQLENPLMYYLCLSTVDRRSRERFMESTQQIAALVEKFQAEGDAFRKGESVVGPPGPQLDLGVSKLQGGHGLPGTWRVAITLYTRHLAATFSLTKSGFKQLFLRLFIMPICFLMLWLFYKDMGDYQHTYVSRSGLIFNAMSTAYFFGIINTIFIFPIYRTRYYQEQQEGLYSGPLFLLTYNLVSLPFSFCSILGSSAIIFSLVGTFNEPMEFLYFALVLWGCYIFTEQQTMAFLMVIKSNITAAICSIYITCVCLTLSSGGLRSMKGLQEWVEHLSHATQPRYAASFLARQTFLSATLADALPLNPSHNCSATPATLEPPPQGPALRCRYPSRAAFLAERWGRDEGALGAEVDVGATFAFSVGMVVFNMFLYLVPLPTAVKAKFRE